MSTLSRQEPQSPSAEIPLLERSTADGLYEPTEKATGNAQWPGDVISLRLWRFPAERASVGDSAHREQAPWQRVVHQPRQPIFGGMQHLDLDAEQAAVLVTLLTRTIADDCYPLSPRGRSLEDILARLRPERTREPLPLPKVYALPNAASVQPRPR